MIRKKMLNKVDKINAVLQHSCLALLSSYDQFIKLVGALRPTHYDQFITLATCGFALAAISMLSANDG